MNKRNSISLIQQNVKNDYRVMQVLAVQVKLITPLAAKYSGLQRGEGASPYQTVN